MTNYAIIIVNYKNEHQTIDYVQNQVTRLTIKPCVVIVNNEATTSSNELLCSVLQAELVQAGQELSDLDKNYVIPAEQNLGFARGNNLGAKFAQSNAAIQYLLFSNNDIKIIDWNVAEVLMNRLINDQSIGMIGPDCLGLDGKSQSPRPYVPFLNKYFLMFFLTPFMTSAAKKKLFKLDYPMYAQEGDHYKLSGSFFMARMSDFIACGMMDPATFLYCEEEILTERMYAIGKRVYYCPAVKIIHEQGHTTSKFVDSKRKTQLDYQSNAYYYSNYKKIPDVLIRLGELVNMAAYYIKSTIKS